MSGVVKRNPRNISPARLEAAVNYNRKWAKHFSNIYSYPDYSELESIGLEAIMACCLKVKDSRRQKGFISYCQVAVRNAIIRHIKKENREAEINNKAIRRLAVLSRDPDRYMPDEPEEGI